MNSDKVQERPFCCFCGLQVVENGKSVEPDPAMIHFPSDSNVIHNDCYRVWKDAKTDSNPDMHTLYTRCYLCTNWVLKVKAVYSADVPYHRNCYDAKVLAIFGEDK